MYMEVLRSIEGIEIFPVISLVVFVTFFGAMLIWTSRLTPEALREYAGMPLESADQGANVAAPTEYAPARSQGRRRS